MKEERKDFFVIVPTDYNFVFQKKWRRDKKMKRKNEKITKKTI